MLILRMLNEHDKNRRGQRTHGINDQLIRVAKPQNAAPNDPESNEDQRRKKGPDRAENLSRALGKGRKGRCLQGRVSSPWTLETITRERPHQVIVMTPSGLSVAFTCTAELTASGANCHWETRAAKAQVTLGVPATTTE